MLMVLGGLVLIVGAPIVIHVFFDTLVELGPRNFLALWANNGGTLLLYFTAGLPLGAILLAAGGARFYPAAKSPAPVLLPLLAIEAVYFIFHSVRYNFDFGLPTLVFGVMGCLLLLLFFGQVWYWARRRPGLRASRQRVADLQLGAGLSFIAAAWQACGLGSAPGFAIRPALAVALANQSFIYGQVLAIQVFMALGFVFLLLAMRAGRANKACFSFGLAAGANWPPTLPSHPRASACPLICVCHPPPGCGGWRVG